MREILACTWKPTVPFQETANLGAHIEALEPPRNEHDYFWLRECQQNPNNPACRLFEL